MTWSNQTPTESGWYWVRNPNNKYKLDIVKVIEHIIFNPDKSNEEYLCVYDKVSGDYWSPNDFDYEWAGPVYPPE